MDDKPNPNDVDWSDLYFGLDDFHVVIGIDPGLEKLGIAVLKLDCRDFERHQIQREEFSSIISKLINEHNPDFIAIGNSTGSKWVMDVLSALGELRLKLVDERGTTLQARDAAWNANPPAGIFKILPKIFWPVPDGIDSWAAVLIAIRGLLELNVDRKELEMRFRDKIRPFPGPF